MDTTTTIAVDQDFITLANDTLKEADRFYAIIEKSLSGSSKFTNDLKYSMILMTVEKYFVALMACYEELPTHHVPLGLFREAEMLEPELTPAIKMTCVLIGKFEGICSLEDFGYRTPSPEDLSAMLTGMAEIRVLVQRRVNGVGK